MKEILDAYAAAARAKDVEAFLALYADDVRSFDLWGVWSYDGKDAYRAMVEEWFGSPDTAAQVESSSTRCAPRSATTSPPSARSPRSQPRRRRHGAPLDEQPAHVGLRRDGDAWKIVHEHTSAPAGDGGQVSLKRG